MGALVRSDHANVQNSILVIAPGGAAGLGASVEVALTKHGKWMETQGSELDLDAVDGSRFATQPCTIR